MRRGMAVYRDVYLGVSRVFPGSSQLGRQIKGNFIGSVIPELGTCSSVDSVFYGHAGRSVVSLRNVLGIRIKQ